MKKNWFWLLPLALLWAGCPVGTDYPLGSKGEEPANLALIGTWVSDNAEAEMRRVSIQKGEGKTYRVEVLERGSMYTLETSYMTAWITRLEGKTFMVAQPDNQDKYYHYCVEIVDANTVKTWDVSLLVGGMDVVTSTAAFRQEVAASLKQPDCLTSEQTWSRE